MQSWFCSCAWYLLMAGVLFGYHLIIVSGIWHQYSWAWDGFVLTPDISLQLGYCFDIILLLSLVSDANFNVYLLLFNLLFFHFLLAQHVHYYQKFNERACITLLIPYLHWKWYPKIFNIKYICKNEKQWYYTQPKLGLGYFAVKNMLCVAGCCCHDITMNLQCQNHHKICIMCVKTVTCEHPFHPQLFQL